MAAPAWSRARGLNSLITSQGDPVLVAVPGIYEIEVGETGVKLSFACFTRSIQLKVAGADIYMALTEAGLDGGNRYPIDNGESFGDGFQVANLYLRAVTGTATVNVLVVLSDLPVPSGFGDMSRTNGFDGGDSSDSVEALGA